MRALSDRDPRKCGFLADFNTKSWGLKRLLLCCVFLLMVAMKLHSVDAVIVKHRQVVFILCLFVCISLLFSLCDQNLIRQTECMWQQNCYLWSDKALQPKAGTDTPIDVSMPPYWRT